MLVAVVLLIALVAVMYLSACRRRKTRPPRPRRKEASQLAPAAMKSSLLVREAEAKLAAAKLEQGARVANLPVYLLMGESGSTKTSIMTHSGLEAELLAGQVYQNNAVVPTRAANFWFARRSVFVEAGGKLPGDSGQVAPARP